MGFIVDDEQLKLDQKLLKYYLVETKAHVKMLAKQKIIEQNEASRLTSALDELKDYKLDPALGDVHENIECQLIKKLGDVGKKVHTCRSRNDQILTDTKLCLKEQLKETEAELSKLIGALAKLAGAHEKTIMPGYSHLQHAEPTTLAFWCGNHKEAFENDIEAVKAAYKLIDSSPLGACAGFGTTLPIDKNMTAKEMGFAKVDGNALYSVSSRGEECIKALSALSLVSLHLSKLANELILWSTLEFGFIELADEYCSGSSIMPQKKNPDHAEIIYSHSSKVHAELFKCLDLLKGLPSGYNRASRETKSAIWVMDMVIADIKEMAGMLATMKVNKGAMLKACDEGYLTATAYAEKLAKQGMPFRDAHAKVKQMVKNGKNIPVTLEEAVKWMYKS